MSTSFVPLIYTYNLASYLSFLKDVFGIEVELTLDGRSYFHYGDVYFELVELPKKRTKLLNNFRVSVPSFNELEAVKNRLEFFYYRHEQKQDVSINKITQQHYQIMAVDPDHREILVEFSNPNMAFRPINLDSSLN